jgi:hypothetical protein
MMVEENLENLMTQQQQQQRQETAGPREDNPTSTQVRLYLTFSFLTLHLHR